MFELNLRQLLPKTVSRCQRSCGKKMTQNDGMLIKTYGTTRWANKKMGKGMSKYGPMYIHFKHYRPDKKFDYSIITLDDETRNNLSDEEKDFLAELGITL